VLRRLLVLLAAAAPVVGAAAADTPSPAPSLAPVEVVLDAPHTQGPQYLAADQQGRLYLLRGHRPTFFRLDRNGKATPWGEKTTAQAETLFRPPLLSAALAPDGHAWLLLTPDDVLLATSSELKRLPDVGWLPLGAGFVGGDPSLSVLPQIRSKPSAQRLDPDDPPFLVGLAGTKWLPLLGDPGARPDDTQHGVDRHRVARDVHLAPASPRGNWMAQVYAYRLSRLTPAGRPEHVVTLGADSEPQHIEDEETLVHLDEKLRERAEMVGMKGALVHPFTARIAVAGITEGTDGRLYVLVPHGYLGSTAVLDRWDAGRLVLERLRLALDYPGLVSMAASPDGLWIAARGSGQQVWFLAWSRLQAAAWQTVDGVEIDGLPLPSLKE